MEKTERTEESNGLEITKERISLFAEKLYYNEKSKATITKYVHAVEQFAEYLNGEAVTKEHLLKYRESLLSSRRPQSVNGILSAIHAYLEVTGQEECKVKFLKVQRKAFLDENRELTQEEYKKILRAAKEQGKERTHLLLMTLASTGIRISELPYITVEAVHKGRVEISLKGKNRVILLPEKLKYKLEHYAKKRGIEQGHIFRTRSGKALDRSNVCHELKALSEMAGVQADKIFPHNFRHLFARVFFEIEKNLAHLADVLGHSRIETTRIYVAVSAAAHQQILDKMQLIC